MERTDEMMGIVVGDNFKYILWGCNTTFTNSMQSMGEWCSQYLEYSDDHGHSTGRVHD